MHTGSDDNSIIRSVLQGDQHAYALLVKRYQDFVFTLCLRYAPHREDAEEIAQDVFVKAYRSLADFRGDARFSTWLFTIVRTSCLTFLRRKRPDTRSLDDERVFEVADTGGGSAFTSPAETKSKIAMVNNAINLLAPDDAKIISLFYQGGQSLDEISHIMGRTPNTIKVKLHRARQRLKEKMEQHFTQEVKDLCN